MENSTVHVSKQNHIMKITFDNKADNNRTDRFALADIAKAVNEANADDDVRVVIFTGNRDAFQTGGKVNATDENERELYMKALDDSNTAWANFNKPLIAAVEGNCFAGGHSIVAKADIAVARKGVLFGFPEILRGAFPIMVQVPLVNLIPKKKFLAQLFTGDNITAEEAERCNLLTCVVEDEEFWPTVNRYAEAIASADQVQLTIGRRNYYGMCAVNTDEERRAVGRVCLAESLKAAAKDI